jgi:hypothetical protein
MEALLTEWAERQKSTIRVSENIIPVNMKTVK